jgi:hypothetical protein
MSTLDFSYYNRPAPDVGRAILQGLQARAQRQEMENVSQDRQRQSLVRDLQGQVLAAPPEQRKPLLTQLQRQAPGEALQLEGAMRENQAGEVDALEKQRALQLGVANRLESALNTVRRQPRLYAQFKESIESRGDLEPGILPNGFNTDEEFTTTMDDLQRRLDLQKSILKDPIIHKPQSEQGKVLMDEKYIPGSRDLYEKKLNKKGGITINTGDGFPATSTMQTKLQDAIVNDQILLGNVEELKGLDPYFDKILTFAGGMKIFGKRALDKAGLLPSDKRDEFIDANRRIQALTGSIFNPLKSAITGAAAAEKEIAKLEDQILNTNMGPQEFRSSLAELEGTAKRTIRIRNKVLREGIRPDSAAYGQRVDRVWKGGGDLRDIGERKARFAELLQEYAGSGVPAAEAEDYAAERMIKEGYYTPDEIQKLQQQGGQ